LSLHDIEDLRQRQSLPLQAKILMTQRRIREWVDYWHDDVYLSFSGGKDSTVLKHIVDQMYDNIPAVFVNTGLEYPEIQQFVREIKAGKYECFNPDVEIVRPEMRFDEVLQNYGYPEDIIEGQINLIDYLGCYEAEDTLETTGCTRTGCMFCMFGCHLEKEPNRFQRMKITHPKQYEYCMNQLGLKEVLEYINVPYE